MAKSMVAKEPLLRNDLKVIAQVLEQSFDYYINHDSPFFPDYLQALRTLVGLGFAAALADRDLLYVYWPNLKSFINQGEGDFKINPGAMKGISQSVVEMVNTAVICFYALNFPRYYKDFIQAFQYTLVKIPGLSSEQEEAKRILARFIVK